MKMYAWYSAKMHAGLTMKMFRHAGYGSIDRWVLEEGNVQLFTVDGSECVATCITPTKDHHLEWRDVIYLGEVDTSSQRTVPASSVPIQEINSK